MAQVEAATEGLADAALAPPVLEIDEGDAGIRAKANQLLEQYGALLEPDSMMRKALVATAPSASTSGALLGPGQSASASTHDAGATSAQYAGTLRRMNKILSENPKGSNKDRSIDVYLNRVRKVPIHRINDQNVQPFTPDAEQAWLIALAAKTSTDSYLDKSTHAIAENFPEGTDMKPMTMYVEERQGRHILVAAVRGSVTTGDWLLNANASPAKSTKILGRTSDWHRGFLRVAEKMEMYIASRITVNISRDCKTTPITEILFTGHSAGAAIAQIFYAMSMTAGSKMESSVKELQRIHCVTFAPPPITNIPFSPKDTTASQAHLDGMFYSVLNEGDPVVVGQQSHLDALLEVYLVPEEALVAKHPDGFKAPAPYFRVLGNCILMREPDPDDSESEEGDLFSVDTSHVEKALFGDPFLHPMAKYMQGLQSILKPN